MHLSDLKSKPVTELVEIANTNEIDGANRMRKHDLIFALLKNQAKKGESIYGDGTLEVLPDGFGFLRSPDTSYLAGTDDIYVSRSEEHTSELQSHVNLVCRLLLEKKKKKKKTQKTKNMYKK